jgi:hypothetical protein
LLTTSLNAFPEIALCIESQGPCTSKLDECFQRFFKETQVDKDIASKLGQILADTGFYDVDEQSMSVPLGEWASTNGMKFI